MPVASYIVTGEQKVWFKDLNVLVYIYFYETFA